MLANLGEIETSAAARGATISPTYFKRTVKDPSWAALDFGAKIHMPAPKGSAAKLGLRFEAKVLKRLFSLYGKNFATGVPISFQESHHGQSYARPQTAIPDGLLLSRDGRSLCIVEIKLRHSTDAWFQLNRFYLPLLRRVVGSSLVLRTLEICLYYDPGVRVPAEKAIIVDAEGVFRLPTSVHPVLIWDRL